MIDKFLIAPITASVYVFIVSPLILYLSSGFARARDLNSDLSNRIFWLVVAAIAIVVCVRHFSRFALPPHIICLLACLAFAGASVTWAFKPEISFNRFVQQVAVVTAFVLPILVAPRTTDIVRALFLCFAIGTILNLLFFGVVGDNGYLAGKNALGAFVAIAFLLAIHELLYPGRRRALGVIVVIAATSLIFLSNSKTSFALALVAPLLAGLMLLIRKTMRISPAVVGLFLVLAYIVLSSLDIYNVYRLSYLLYGDSTLSLRTLIWDFVLFEIERRPHLGWGYQSFWLVGPDGPAVAHGPGWIALMPHAHNGYLDIKLQMGRVGLALLVIFIFATLHAIGRMSDRAPRRAWLMLSIVIFAALHNFLESSWMRGADVVWVVFLIAAADIGRYWKPFPSTTAAARIEYPASGGPGRARRMTTLARRY